MTEAEKLFDECLAQEQALVFKHFTREDALKLGLLLNENAHKGPAPVAIEITVNGLSVFRYMPETTMADNNLWLKRKRNTVNLMQMTSLRFLAFLNKRNETLVDRKLNPDEYAAGGGGFPIHVEGIGVVGSICVSGLPHLQDHQLLVNTLTEFIKAQA